MHQNTGLSSNAIYAQIEIPVIPDRDGQYLRNLLIDRLYTKGHPDNPRYVLNIQPLQLDTTNLGIQKDATVTRRQIDIRTDMELIDRDHPNPVLIRTFRAVGGYDVLDAQYATQIKERRVIEQVLTEIADSIVNDINLYFKKARP